jgi:O-antigen ligase
MATTRYDLSLINSRIFGLYGLFISVSVSVSSFLAYLMLMIFLVQGNLKERFFELKNNPLAYAVLAFVLLHFLGLFWTEDFVWAKNVLKREWKLVFVLLFMLIVKKKHINYYLKMFIVGMSISELVSYAIWFEIIPPFMHASIENPTPFMKHLSYNIYLAISIYLLLSFIIFDVSVKIKAKLIMLLFLVTMSINMFITGGRAGQIALLVMVCFLAFSLIQKHLKYALIILSGTCLSFLLAYYASPLFYERANLAVKEVANFENNHNTSVGIRMALALNSFELIKKNLFFGVGTGDLLLEYKKVNETSAYQTPIMHPHNMYLLMLIQFGLVGFASLLALFVLKIKIALRIHDELRNFRFAFIAMFMIVMLSNSYLYTHHTMVLYMFFTAFLFKMYDN